MRIPQSRMSAMNNCRLPITNGQFVLLLVVCCCLLVSCNSKDTGNSNSMPLVSGPPGTRYPMPHLKGASRVNMGWELADGKRSVFSEHRGKVLILDFYAIPSVL